MNNRLAIAASVLVMFAATAHAHAHLKKSVPAPNSSVVISPTKVELTFSEAATLTALSIQRDGEPKAQAIKPLPEKPAATLSVPLKPLAPGSYTITWRVLSDDNHIVAGKLQFKVQGP